MAQDLEETRLRDETFPPLSETADDSKNWPGPCPFLHLKIKELAIIDKQNFLRQEEMSSPAYLRCTQLSRLFKTHLFLL
jgi:hypothetical protein